MSSAHCLDCKPYSLHHLVFFCAPKVKTATKWSRCFGRIALAASGRHSHRESMVLLSLSCRFSIVTNCAPDGQGQQQQQRLVPSRKCAPFLHQRQASTEWKAVPDLWRSSAEKFGDRIALVDPHRHPPCKMTYKEVEQSILDFAEGLRILGVLPDEHVALFAENSCRWLITDQGIMATGAANAVRGSRSSLEELLYVYSHSDSVGLVVDSQELLKRLTPGLKKASCLRFIVQLWGSKPSVNEFVNVPILTYEECLSAGKRARESHTSKDEHYEPIQPGDVATLVYTSGTTGKPKGVVLTHANLLHQAQHLIQCIQPLPGDRFLSLLPPWHAYERASEYFIFTRGIEQVYTNVKSLKDDLQRFPAQYFVSVPLVYDTLYSEIQKKIRKASPVRRAIVLAFMWISSQYLNFNRFVQGRSLADARIPPDNLAAAKWLLACCIARLLFPLHVLGKKLVHDKIRAAVGIEKSGISGGGSLPSHVDKFFETVGVTIFNGYGLTEASPVVATRALPDNVLGTVGWPLKHTQVKAVDLETKERVKDGERGLIMARGPQVMKAYYKDPAATKSAVDEEGWLNTGDLGWIAPRWSSGPARRCGGMLVLEGRAKDTIVLLTGENVEPIEVEEAALQSPLIEQIMVVGQDQRRLGALILPSKEAAASSSDEELRAVIREELNRCLKGCVFPIGPFHVLAAGDAFTVDNGLLTPTMKLRRGEILSKYREVIDLLFKT